MSTGKKGTTAIHYLLTVVIIGGVALASSPLDNTRNYHLVSYILLFVVSILSTVMGIGPVLLASTLGAVVWNFFFIPPHHTFHIEKTEDILIFGLFFIIALANGVLTTRIRRQEKLAREREKRTNALFQLTKELSKASGMEEVLQVAIKEINRHFTLEPFFILQDGSNILNKSGRLQKDKIISPDDYRIADWVFKNRQKAGAHTHNFNESGSSFYPLPGTRINPGVVAVKQKKSFSDEQVSFWDTFIAQVSNALEREFLGEMAQKVRFLDESDRLYKTLFNSISHEFRIPVATIMGASDSMVNSTDNETVQGALSREIFTASLRLNRLVENLLNMSRLESGHISVRKDWYDFNDLVNKLSEDLEEELKSYKFKLTVPEDMPLVKFDFGLMEQVLYNLIFNSTQYAPEGTAIELAALRSNSHLTVTIRDHGPGFPEIELKNVFRKFFRVEGSKTGGLGLGLSIVKGFVEAHNGTIAVENMADGGAKFTILIPSEYPDIKNLQIEPHGRI